MRKKKQKVADGLLCYICTEKPPVATDFMGGHVCAECYARLRNALLRHALRGGYRQR